LIDRPALEAAVRDADPAELSQLAGELQHRAFVASVAAIPAPAAEPSGETPPAE